VGEVLLNAPQRFFLVDGFCEILAKVLVPDKTDPSDFACHNPLQRAGNRAQHSVRANFFTKTVEKVEDPREIPAEIAIKDQLSQEADDFFGDRGAVWRPFEPVQGGEQTGNVERDLRVVRILFDKVADHRKRAHRRFLFIRMRQNKDT
jgi:hypothetical protein